MSRALAAWLATWLAGTAACAAPTGMGRARTLEPGRSQLGAGLELAVFAPRTAAEQPVHLPWAGLSAHYRRGLNRWLEAGARSWVFGVPAYWTWGGAADLKVQLHRAPPGRLDLAAGLLASYGELRLGGQPARLAGVQLPLLLGLQRGRTTVVASPRVGAQLLFGEGMEPVAMPLWGLNLGLLWRPARRFELYPELSFLYAPVGFDGEAGDLRGREGAWHSQLSIGCLWDL
jgi:hypothetical protein